MRRCSFESPPADGAGAGQGCAAVILAAGKGTRMASDLPKVLHELDGKPLLRWVVDASRSAGLDPQILVVGHLAERVEATMRPHDSGDLRFVLQAEQKGTGHAVQMAEPILSGLEGDVLVLAGDVPLIRAETLADLLAEHRHLEAAATVLTAELADPGGYGRILRNTDGDLAAIREHRDCTEDERAVREINSGIYCFRLPDLLESLAALRSENEQGEYYLTDTLEILCGKGRRVAAMLCADPAEIAGINDREQLAAMEAGLRERGG